jgi:2-dehydropantoate 2-reductase
MLGACLAKTGHTVTMVVRPESLAQYPRQLTLESPFGNFTVLVERSATVPPCDVLWIAVKATQLDVALGSFPPEAQVKAIVPLLNGIDHVAFLRSRYGAERVVPGTIAGEMERVAAGQTVHRTPFARLQLGAAGRPLLGSMLEQLRQLGFTGDFIDDEPTLLWGKLVLLAPLALATSAAGATKGEISTSPQWRPQLEACVREACAVAIAEGARVNADTGLALIEKLPAPMRSSMQKDVAQGKPPELDAIGGPIVRGGARHGIPVPVTRGLIAAIEQKIGLARTGD